MLICGTCLEEMGAAPTYRALETLPHTLHGYYLVNRVERPISMMFALSV